MLKKINSKNDFYFKSNKLNHNLIDEMSLKIDLAYGNMNFVKNSSFSGNDFKCEGSINFLEEFPLLYFDCSLISDNKKKLLRKFSIKIPKKDKTFQLFAKGNFSILNKKINLKNVTTNNNYKASKEDLRYYDTVFEKIFLSESFVEILNKKKIKEFVLEVY